MVTTAQISQFINKEANTAGASGNMYWYLGAIFLTINADMKNSAMIITALISKKNRCELDPGVINEISQLPKPITGGYSNEFVAERYGKVLVSKPRSEKSAGMSV